MVSTITVLHSALFIVNILAIDYGTKILGVAHYNDILPLPLGNIENNGDMRFTLMGLIAEKKISSILVGFPKHPIMQEHINKFIKTLQMMFEGEVLKVNEDYSSVQAQVITWELKKHVAHDTLAAMELINRYLGNKEKESE